MEHDRNCDTIGESYEKTPSPLISHSMSTMIDRRIAVRVTNTTETPYLIKKNTQIAEFRAITREQSKHFESLDLATLGTISKGDLDVTAYLNDLLRTYKPEQPNNTFWFSTPETPGKPKDHTPIQTRTLTKQTELKDKEKLNPQQSREFRNNFLKRFDWTGTLLTETKKQAIEGILVDYHEIFARHRMDIGMNTEFKVKLTPKDVEAIYSRSMPMPIQLNEDLIVDLALMHKYGVTTLLPFSPSRQVPYFHRGSPTGNYVFLWISEKSAVWLRMPIPVTTIQLAPYQTQQNTWQESLFSASLTAPKLITAWRWWTSGRWKSSHSIWPADLWPTKDLLKVSADLCLPFQVSSASTWTELSELTNKPNRCMTLELQSIMLRILPGTIGQSSSAFANQDWNWHSRSGTSESDKLNS